MRDDYTTSERQALERTMLRANGQAWGVTTGLLLGLGLALATIVLVIKDGPDPGPHLGLLRVYFPGYSITWGGAALGFLYALGTGYIGGRVVAAIYNRLLPHE